MQITDTVRASMQSIVDYLWDAEEKSFEEDERPAGHIFHDVVVLSAFLKEIDGKAFTFPSIRVENMGSARGGKEVPNQFQIRTEAGIFFQSYASVIAYCPHDEASKTVLDASKWDYSTTTGKYRSLFLGESIDETRKKIKSGEYILANLNA